MDQNKVITFAKLSWQELKPEDNYDVKLELMPEVIRRHEDMVRCYLENDFNSERVIKIMTHFKLEFDDLEESAQQWHKKLVVSLKRLSKMFSKA